jgi:hypothetical protein
MSEPLEEIEDAVQERGRDSRFHGFIAAFVAVAATFMALCNVKDGNVVQAMQQAQAKSVDQWAYYQAKGSKQHLAENTAETLQAMLDLNPAAEAGRKARIETRIAGLRATAKREGEEKEKVRADAEQAGKDYDAMNLHDDQFDLAEASLSVAVALSGVAALTGRRWLFGLACGFGAVGFLFGLAGFLGWSLHSDLMARLLG